MVAVHVVPWLKFSSILLAVGGVRKTSTNQAPAISKGVFIFNALCKIAGLFTGHSRHDLWVRSGDITTCGFGQEIVKQTRGSSPVWSGGIRNRTDRVEPGLAGRCSKSHESDQEVINFHGSAWVMLTRLNPRGLTRSVKSPAK